jgi:hypothetical protein
MTIDFNAIRQAIAREAGPSLEGSGILQGSGGVEHGEAMGFHVETQPDAVAMLTDSLEEISAMFEETEVKNMGDREIGDKRKTENRFFYQLPPLEISSELYAAFEKDLDLHPPDTVLLPGREEEREWTDIRLKGIREKLLGRSYSSEVFDEFELFTRNRDAS